VFAVIRDLYRNDKRFAFGFTVLAFFVIIAFVSRFAPYDMRAWNTVPRDLRPSLQHPLGTNSIGQDIMWKAMAAIKNSLLLGVIAAAISRVIAIVVGLLSGYKGGLFDRVVMVLTDSFIIIPLFPILILIATILRSSLNMVVLGIVIGLFGWAWDARLFRSQILSLKEREFTRTAVFSGLKTFKIVTTEHLPYIVPLVMDLGDRHGGDPFHAGTVQPEHAHHWHHDLLGFAVPSDLPGKVELDSNPGHYLRRFDPGALHAFHQYQRVPGSPHAAADDQKEVSTWPFWKSKTSKPTI